MTRWIPIASTVVAVFLAGLWISTLFADVQVDHTRIDRSADPIETSVTASLGTVPHQFRIGVTRIRMDRGQSLVTLDAYLPAGFTWRQLDPAAADAARPWWPVLNRPPTVDTGFGRRTTATLVVPLWLPLALTIPLPAWRLRRWWTRRRWPATACDRCGYDLRGSAGRCPECGRGA